MKTNYRFGDVLQLNDVIAFSDSKVAVKNIFETENGGIVCLAMREGQKLDTHTAPFEVMVTVIDGEIEFKMLDTPHILTAGEFLLMGANVAHSVEAKKDSKIMLIKIKGPEIK